MTRRSFLPLGALALALVALSPRTAHALYIGPTLGSTALQVVAAGVLGAAYSMRHSWRRVRDRARDYARRAWNRVAR